jgi:hypothetical protein
MQWKPVKVSHGHKELLRNEGREGKGEERRAGGREEGTDLRAVLQGSDSELSQDLFDGFLHL